MAKPRLFVSSTLWDQRHVRSDLRAFGNQMGFEVIQFEKGDMSYDGESVDDACREEVDKCDIVISIIGQRSGTLAPSAKAEGRWASFSKLEVERAVERNLQILVFVEDGVWHEYQTWRANRTNQDFASKINWNSVDSPRVFEFIDDVMRIERNKGLYQFRDSQHLMDVLRAQLASLFQNLLRRSSQERFTSHMRQILGAVEDLRKVTEFVQNKAEEDRVHLDEILFIRHPVFDRLQTLMNCEVRIFFETFGEMEALMQLLGFKMVPEDEMLDKVSKRYWYWRRRSGEGANVEYLGVAKVLFAPSAKTSADRPASPNQLQLVPLERANWKEEFVVDDPPRAVAAQAQPVMDGADS
jgi:hypothetical protein